jgi:two-component sensor histidine kinase
VRFKGLTLDITARKQAEDQKNLLISVLDRQVKKLLARIAVVAKDCHHSVGTADECIRALDGRIQSMADAHALLSKHRWQGAPLAELIRRQLAFHASDANVVLAGSETTLSVSATQALAMVLHELVTNAARYGALSTPFGRVEVSWKHDTGADSRNLSIEWSEIGGPPIAAPPEFRYGLGIIRDVIPHELDGSVDLDLAPTGFCCKMEFPMVAEGEASS